MTVCRVVDDRPDRQEPSAKARSPRRRGRSSGSDAVEDGAKRYHGDGLIVRMESNRRALVITGDGCRIVLSRNTGSVHVVGDGCWLRVNHNAGNIEYTGDGGRVLLGPDSSKEKVKFVGDGGEVILDAAPETIEYRDERGRSRVPREPATGDRRDDGSDRVRGTACSCEETVERSPPGYEKRVGPYGDGRTTLSRECLDNLANEMRERGQRKRGEREAETRKCARRRTVTAEIITKIQTDGRCVRKRFGERSLIVNSTGEKRTVTSAPRGSGTSTE